MLAAVNFHYVRPSFDAPYPSIHGLTPAQFEAQLATLARAGTFVSAEQVLTGVRGGVLPERSILVTFDDGLREQFDYAWPVLRRMGIPALFFVNTAPCAEHRVLSVHRIHLLRSIVAPADFEEMLRQEAASRGVAMIDEIPIDAARAQYPYDTDEGARLKYLLNAHLNESVRETLVDACFTLVYGDAEVSIAKALYMGLDEVRQLDGCVGSHTHSHLPLQLLDSEAARREIALSLAHLEEWLGHRPFAMSYPYGSREACSEAIGTMAADHGVAYTFTMERAVNRTLAGPQLLARIDCNDAPGGKVCRYEPERLFETLPDRRWFAAAPC